MANLNNIELIIEALTIALERDYLHLELGQIRARARDRQHQTAESTILDMNRKVAIDNRLRTIDKTIKEALRIAKSAQ